MSCDWRYALSYFVQNACAQDNVEKQPDSTLNEGREVEFLRAKARKLEKTIREQDRITQGLIRSNGELTMMVHNNDTLIQGLTEELTQTQRELAELKETHIKTLQEANKNADEVVKQRFYKQKLDTKMQMAELELQGLRTQLAKAERYLIECGVVLAKPISCATDVAENMERIATTQGESSRTYRRQQKLLDRVVDF